MKGGLGRPFSRMADMIRAVLPWTDPSCQDVPEQFQEKWEPVFRPELRENNMSEQFSFSLEIWIAPGRKQMPWRPGRDGVLTGFRTEIWLLRKIIAATPCSSCYFLTKAPSRCIDGQISESFKGRP
ncbi:hypothetical protein ACFO1V_15085 [Daeguia caeni]|uniref:Uncharacterized protein n=1 Tax=Daeguia caeni TaxID=439612 RepID=A0ABV9H8B6_9HYPH